MEKNHSDVVRVLVVGNNPIDLSGVSSKLLLRTQPIETEIAFDVKSLQERLQHFTPDYIVLDDNLGRTELKEVVKWLLRDKHTRHVPITVLKNSNYIETIGSGALNFVLKQNLTGEALFRAMTNSLKFRKTQRYLAEAYRKRKGQLLRMVKPAPGYQI
jgi:CheY-like chemotaxis protein